MKHKISMVIALVVLLSGMLTSCTSNQQDIELIENQIKTLEEQVGTLEAEKNQLNLDLEAKSAAILGYETTLEEQATEIEALKAELEDVDQAAMMGPTPSVITTSQQVIEALKTEDFATLATFVHPSLGVRLTPYSYIDLANDVVLTSVDIASLGTSPTTILWGSYDGSGDPIQLTPYNYYNEFIYDEDYDNADIISHNTVIGTGNMIQNIGTAYPTADFIEYHFTGFNPTYEGIDWSSLTLIYEQQGGLWYLVGIIHGQWTI
jgi:outer membrane murein-binding lipoprotein Lpp